MQFWPDNATHLWHCWLEKKLDELLQKVEPEKAQEIIEELKKIIPGEIEKKTRNKGKS